MHNNKIQRLLLLSVVGLLVVVLAVTVSVSVANNREQRALLRESVKSELLSITIAAREMIDIEEFYSYNSRDDVDAGMEAYDHMRAQIISLRKKVDADYIYVLKEIDGKYYFVFDADDSGNPETMVDIFSQYDEVSDIHKEAYTGVDCVGIMNVVDQWGSFNAAAIPIFRDNEVIGIVCADVEDEYIRASESAANTSVIILIVALVAVMCFNIIIIRQLVIQPINHLTNSISHVDIDMIYGINRNDEFGMLARTIRESNEQLLAVLDKAKEASVAKSNFLSNMSHEIRTPMNAIIGMTSIAKATDDLEQKNNALGKIEGASIHLLGVINDVLDVSKIESGKFELAPTEFNFEKMLVRIINVNTLRVDEKKQWLSVYVDRNIPQFMIGDDQHLAQVITNLLGNAIKFTPDEGSIKIHTYLLGEENGICEIKISIEDSGIGISPKQQAKLFQSFQQAESSTSRKFGGTGLGLAISKSIVELMGGTIWIESELGNGATFSFTVKMKRSEKKLAQKEIEWQSLRILAVDDDPNILQDFRGIVQKFGAQCDTALNGTEALALIDQNDDYNLYFVDWRMPDMNGIELTAKLKKKINQRSDSFVVMVSAADFGTIAKDAKQAGVDKFLQKPLFPSTVSDIVSDLLGYTQQQAGDPGDSIEGMFKGHCILLAEDVEINREIVLALLAPTGLEIHCAENGEEAVRMFVQAHEKYELIFMDMQMPGMDGLEATRQIRAQNIPKAKDIPIIAMTANVFKEDIEKCLAAGMNSHIGKPLVFENVLTVLRAYLL